ncbi:TPM domain-containing protein [Paenibacillus yanchengensis]|uniref:TPM domain-containing protein n=1 Tax=Paenibacillus yanchengensis TaxID=2035833 RepID=A0ABW4YJQ2_9BACL
MKLQSRIVLIVMIFILFGQSAISIYATSNQSPASKRYIYDQASILSKEEYISLKTLMQDVSIKHQTDVMIVTNSGIANTDTQYMTEQFYDDFGPGYEGKHGSTAILYVDITARSIYLAGYGQAKETLNDKRLDKINVEISRYFAEGKYYEGMYRYVELADQFMAVPSGVSPDNWLFNRWFQLGLAIIIGIIVVAILGYRPGQKLKVTFRTYEDKKTSQVIASQDQYLHSTVTKSKIERNNGSSGGGFSGGGGGVSGGGHSHSGSKGSF